jgi:hypothetical protein
MFFFKFKNTFLNCIFLFFFILYSHANAQNINYSEEYDEVPTLLIIENIFNVNLNSIYNYNNNQLYLPIIEMFNLLNINIKASNYLDTIQGYFCNENNLYGSIQIKCC